MNIGSLKINKIDKYLARLTKKKKNDSHYSNHTRKWRHYHQLYRNKKDHNTMNNCMLPN